MAGIVWPTRAKCSKSLKVFIIYDFPGETRFFPRPIPRFADNVRIYLPKECFRPSRLVALAPKALFHSLGHEQRRGARTGGQILNILSAILIWSLYAIWAAYDESYAV